MRELSYEEEFDKVLLIFISFGYFEDEENIRVLKNVSKSLKSGGLFCFDTFNRDSFLKYFQPYKVLIKGDDAMIDQNHFDSLTGRVFNKRIVYRKGVRKEKPFFVKLYNPTEIREILKTARLSIYKIFADFDSKPFSSDSWRMVIIARKE